MSETDRPIDAQALTNEALDAVILTLLQDRGMAKTICPSEVARLIAGSDEKAWRHLMKPIRARAVALAKDGVITIKRKGHIVDPDRFKGVYRLGLPPEHGATTNQAS